ncbi:MAG: hypothetical protein H7833_04455 [Magnetococcus sp. DMHC-1]
MYNKWLLVNKVKICDAALLLNGHDPDNINFRFLTREQIMDIREVLRHLVEKFDQEWLVRLIKQETLQIKPYDMTEESKWHEHVNLTVEQWHEHDHIPDAVWRKYYRKEQNLGEGDIFENMNILRELKDSQFQNEKNKIFPYGPIRCWKIESADEILRETLMVERESVKSWAKNAGIATWGPDSIPMVLPPSLTLAEPHPVLATPHHVDKTKEKLTAPQKTVENLAYFLKHIVEHGKFKTIPLPFTGLSFLREAKKQGVIDAIQEDSRGYLHRAKPVMCGILKVEVIEFSRNSQGGGGVLKKILEKNPYKNQ